MKKKARQIALVLVVLLLILAFDNRLKVANYSVSSQKLDENIRLALITDLHSCKYGEGQKTLIKAIEAQKPDVILLAGDIADDQIPHDNTKLLLEAIGRQYPCYYVSGNHEYWSGEIDAIKEMFRSYGVTVLEGDTKKLMIRGQEVTISGIDDPDGGLDYLSQLEACKEQANPSAFNILIAHRPELIETYLEGNFDLVTSGHVHGGQWRLPGVINGLYAPNQGVLPPYAGGFYHLEQTSFVVSRGLARESTRLPRIFNRPELVMIDCIQY